MKAYSKAIFAFVSSLLASLAAALIVGSPGDAALTAAELVGALSVAVLTTGTVLFSPANAPDVKHAAGSPDINDGV